MYKAAHIYIFVLLNRNEKLHSNYDSVSSKKNPNIKRSSSLYYTDYFDFLGTVLCLSIVWCNLAVSRALSRISRRAVSLRRICKASSRAKPLLTVAGPPNRPEVATTEEKAFARLMAVLSISFVICWMPHMVSLANPISFNL